MNRQDFQNDARFAAALARSRASSGYGPSRIRAELATRHFNLLETLGEYVIGLLLNEFGAPWVKISIAKMGIMKGVRRVGVQIERSR